MRRTRAKASRHNPRGVRRKEQLSVEAYRHANDELLRLLQSRLGHGMQQVAVARRGEVNGVEAGSRGQRSPARRCLGR